MAGHAITVQRVIEAPVERVWEVLTDLDHAAERRTAITEVEILTDGPYAVGTTWRETRRLLGRTQTRELCVTDNDPLRRTVIEASSSGAAHRTVFVLTPQGQGLTELSAEFAAETAAPSGVRQVFWAGFGRRGLKVTARALQRDLDDIAAAATAR